LSTNLVTGSSEGQGTMPVRTFYSPRQFALF
jgi:hypothetical protein